MNEILYATLPLGNRFPVGQLQSVEIIRGPGSAEYGGFAELAVVSLKTRGAKDLDGFAASAQYGQFQGGLARRTLSAGYGQTIGDRSLSAQAFVGQGQRSTATYRDPVDPPSTTAWRGTRRSTPCSGDVPDRFPPLVDAGGRPPLPAIRARGLRCNQLGQKGLDLYLNLFATWKNLLLKGLELGAGVHDLLGRGESYPQPYAGGHPPLPGPGREFLVRLSYAQGS